MDRLGQDVCHNRGDLQRFEGALVLPSTLAAQYFTENFDGPSNIKV